MYVRTSKRHTSSSISRRRSEFNCKLRLKPGHICTIYMRPASREMVKRESSNAVSSQLGNWSEEQLCFVACQETTWTECVQPIQRFRLLFAALEGLDVRDFGVIDSVGRNKGWRVYPSVCREVSQGIAGGSDGIIRRSGSKCTPTGGS